MSFIINPYAFGGAAPAFAPDDIAGLRLWLDADDASTITESGGAVSAWTSKDANARGFTQGTGSLQPTTGSATLNSLNVVSFAADYLTSSAAASVWEFLHDGTQWTFVAVWKPGTTADPNEMYGLFGTSASLVGGFRRGAEIRYDDRAASSLIDNLGLLVYRDNASANVVLARANGTLAPNVHSLVRGVFAPSAATASRAFAFVDAVDTGIVNTATNAPGTGTPTYSLAIGSTGNGQFPLTGEIAELLIYEAVLSSGEIASVEAYLADKWGITL